MTEVLRDDYNNIVDKAGKNLGIVAMTHVMNVQKHERTAEYQKEALDASRATDRLVASPATVDHDQRLALAEQSIDGEKWRAYSHYKQNEAGYQQSAYEEATAAGHDINFHATPHEQADMIVQTQNAQAQPPETDSHQ